VQITVEHTRLQLAWMAALDEWRAAAPGSREADRMFMKANTADLELRQYEAKLRELHAARERLARMEGPRRRREAELAGSGAATPGAAPTRP